VKTVAGLAVDDAGTPDARPPLVLLHGLTFDRSMWQPALAELTRIDPGRRTLAIDLPGHGGSTPWASYDIDSVAVALRTVVDELGVDRPIVVGHSLAAIVATVYAARFPTRGVVNVDQPLQTAPFAGFLQSIAEQLRSASFPALWQQFAASMHVELLPTDAQHLLESTTTPRQDLVLGYWREVLDRPVGELVEKTNDGLASLRSANVRYLVVAGSPLEAAYQRWLEEVLPQATVTVLEGSGHFPHLAHPDQFAQLLAQTADWA
jgi:pimeloyl-ACP methyl ester carboxylesterase